MRLGSLALGFVLLAGCLQEEPPSSIDFYMQNERLDTVSVFMANPKIRDRYENSPAEWDVAPFASFEWLGYLKHKAEPSNWGLSCDSAVTPFYLRFRIADARKSPETERSVLDDQTWTITCGQEYTLQIGADGKMTFTDSELRPLEPWAEPPF